VPNTNEQAAIAGMKHMKAEGLSLRQIAEAVRARGFDVSHVTVGRVLRDNR
jgi:transposase-like protein